MEAVRVVVLAAFATAAACPWLIGFLRRRSLVDEENDRTSHKGAIPRGGGLAVLFGVIVSLAVHWTAWVDVPYLPAVAIFAAAFGLLGLIDDVYGLPATIRLVAQAILAWLFMAATGLEPVASLTFLGAVAGAFWIVAFVNTFNFMDGINGISAATTLIIGTSLAIASYRWEAGIEIPALAIVGAAIGFAPFNAPSARLFLGDVGSYLLGSALAMLAVVAVSNGAPPLAVFLPFLLYVGDVAYTLVSRALRHERLMKPHREHVYQVITRPGALTHQQTTLLVSAITVALAILAHTAGSAGTAGQSLALLLAVGILAWYLLLPRRSRFRIR